MVLDEGRATDDELAVSFHSRLRDLRRVLFGDPPLGECAAQPGHRAIRGVDEGQARFDGDDARSGRAYLLGHIDVVLLGVSAIDRVTRHLVRSYRGNPAPSNRMPKPSGAAAWTSSPRMASERAAFRRIRLMRGLAPNSRAASPATAGLAIDVPLITP